MSDIKNKIWSLAANEAKIASGQPEQVNEASEIRRHLVDAIEAIDKGGLVIGGVVIVGIADGASVSVTGGLTGHCTAVEAVDHSYQQMVKEPLASAKEKAVIAQTILLKNSDMFDDVECHCDNCVEERRQKIKH